MIMECTSSTIQHTRQREPVIRLAVSEVLGRELSNPVGPLALSLAAQVFTRCVRSSAAFSRERPSPGLATQFSRSSRVGGTR